MARAILRKVAGMMFAGFTAYFITRHQHGRPKRMASRRKRIVAEYDAMLADPEFMKELVEMDDALDGCAADGLEAGATA